MIAMLKKYISIKTYLDEKIIVNVILYWLIKLGQDINILTIIRRPTLIMKH